MNELKQCPFCGSKARTSFNDNYYTILCTNENCGATITRKANVFDCACDEAWDAWNRRDGDAT